MIIAFDVDGTLVTYNDKPRWDIIELVKTLSQYHTVIVWSGGGKDYSEMWIRKLFLEDFVRSGHGKYDDDVKGDYVDLCFDDENVDLAKINIKV